MQRHHLRWWAFVCVTVVVMVMAGVFGLYQALVANDLTRISFAIIGGYILTTGWIGWSLYRGAASHNVAWYIADVMERAGIFATFVGMAIAFQAVGNMDAGGEWKHELMLGVSTKFFCSLVGMSAAFMVKTQVKLLDPNYEA